VLRPGSPLILPMTERDVDAVTSVAASAFAQPWAREVFCEELSRPWSVLRVLRATPGGPICAFANVWLVRDEVHVLNLATAPDCRRRGYARLLLDDVLGFARTHRARYITLEVRRSNAAAQQLYKTSGFAAIGVRPRYYVEDDEDAVVMLLTLDPETGLAEPREDVTF